MTLQQAVFAGLVDPGNMVAVRAIVNNVAPNSTDVDTSVYSGPRSQYTITRNADGSVTVCDSVTIAAAAGEVLLHEALKGDGCDILWRIEQLSFTDGTISVAAATAPAVTTAPTAATGLAFGSVTLATTSAPQAVTVTNSGNGPLSISGFSIAGLDFAVGTTTCLAGPIAPGGTCTVNVTFTPQAIGARSSTLLIADNAAGSPQGIPLTGNGTGASTQLLGTSTVGTKSDSNVAGLAEAFKTTATTTGSVSALRIFVDTGSVGSVVAGLYANSATNHPGARLTSGTLAAPTIGAFNSITVPAASVTAGQTYWIAILGPTGTLHFRDRAAVGAGNSETNSPGGLTSLPATWTTNASFTDGTLSGFAVGTAAPPDTTLPTVSMTAPAAAATVSGTAVAVSANAADNVGVVGVQFKLDGANLAAEDTTAPYSVNWDSTSATNGSHSLTAVARDAAGNTATAAARTVTVSNAAPLAVKVGNAATEAKLDSDVAGRAEAFKTTASATGSVTALRVFVDTGSTGNVMVALYSNVAGHPGTRLTTGTIAAPTAGANNTVTVPAAAVTAGQTYWIAVLSTTGTIRFRDRGAAGAGSSETSSLGTLTSLPATWTTGTAFSDGFLSAVGLG
jgi:hypothetical protein